MVGLVDNLILFDDNRLKKETCQGFARIGLRQRTSEMQESLHLGVAGFGCLELGLYGIRELA